MTANRIGEGEERAMETGLTPEEFEAAREEIIALLSVGSRSKGKMIIGEEVLSVTQIIEQIQQGTPLGNEFVRLHMEVKSFADGTRSFIVRAL